MEDRILASIKKGVQAIESLGTELGLRFIEDVARLITVCYQKGNKLIIAGNGGSLCDAMHFSEELTGFFRDKRKALPAIALADAAHITCVGNDLGFDSIFSRGVEAHGVPGDIFIALSTSGNSPNIIKALQVAKEKGLETISFLGKTGGQAQGLADLEWIVSGFAYSDRIQEAHMTAIHIIIEMVEKELFYKEEMSIALGDILTDVS